MSFLANAEQAQILAKLNTNKLNMGVLNASFRVERMMNKVL